MRAMSVVLRRISPLAFPISIIVVFAASLIFSCVCLGDTLVLKNGKSYEGKLIARDAKTVTFEMHKFGMKAVKAFEASEVLTVTEGQLKSEAEEPAETEAPDAGAAEKYSGDTYFVIPIEGTFGLQVTDSVFRKCLNLARGAKPTVVVLEINSGGGAVLELTEMLETLKGFADLRTVAYVEQAASAAAFLAMSCKEIVMAPAGSIGGCVIYSKGPGGTPENIEEKFSSIYRAQFRSMATAAGHDPLLIEGMMRDDIALSLEESDGPAKIVEGDGGRSLKKKGKILTLSAREAVACGLAVGLADSVDASGKVLGIEKWKQLPGSAKRICRGWRRQIDNAVREYESTMKQATQFYDDAVAASHAIKNSQSLAEARHRVNQCIGHLELSEQKLARAEALAAKYPGLVRGGLMGHSANAISESRSKIEAVKKILEAYR